MRDKLTWARFGRNGRQLNVGDWVAYCDWIPCWFKGSIEIGVSWREQIRRRVERAIGLIDGDE